MAIQIREAQPSDLELVVDIQNASWARANREILPDDYLESDTLRKSQTAYWTERLNVSPTVAGTVIAETDGKVAGVASYEFNGDESVELTDLYVTPFYWSTGIGSALQRDVRDRWRADGKTHARLWAPVENPRAHRSYKKNGWDITEEERTRMVDGHELPEHMLTLEL